MIDYIQDQPKFRLIQTEHNTLIEKVGGKYQALMRKIQNTIENIVLETLIE